MTNFFKTFKNKAYYEIDKLNVKSTIKQVEKSKKTLKTLKDKYDGKRCFIIGNGPSLTVSDLEMLNNECTFASHGIYYIYNETGWRPTFYCAQDSALINERYIDIQKKCYKSQNFFGVVPGRKYPKFDKNAILINLLDEHFGECGPSFSKDLTECAYEGMTVTYFNIQLAIYMGFKEIYLLGVDHFYAGADSGQEHFYKLDTCSVRPQTDKSTLAYIKAREIAETNNIKILNATRGGHLEVFERASFDELIKGE